MGRCSISLGDSRSLWIVKGFFCVIIGHYGWFVGGSGKFWVKLELFG